MSMFSVPECESGPKTAVDGLQARLLSLRTMVSHALVA